MPTDLWVKSRKHKSVLFLSIDRITGRPRIIVPMRYAYLTCELLGRDLDSRLLIAAHLLKRGVSCVIGQQWAIFANSPTCPKGVFLFKTANNVQGVNAALCRQAGHSVVMSDEEVLALADPNEIKNGTSPEAVKAADVFLALDERHRSIVQSVGTVKCEIAGNVRIDLLMRHADVYRTEVSKIKEAGPYILFNTNFGTINSTWANEKEALAVMYGALGLPPELESTQAFGRDLVAFENKNRLIVEQLITLVRSKFDRRIVVRPHPAEALKYWTGREGIEVVSKTNPIPWLLRTDLMIHTGSTTGLEAAIVGAPCLNVNPTRDTRFAGMFIVNNINATVSDESQAAAAIRDFLLENAGPIAEKKPPPFATGAAEYTAQVIAALTRDVPQLRSWGVHQSKQRQIDKFDISLSDFVARTKAVFDSVGVKSAQVGQIDRALFLLS